MVQDLAALNKHELLLWDHWGMSRRDLTAADERLLDQVASVTVAGGDDLSAITQLYEAEADLRVPPVIESRRWGEFRPFLVQLN